MMSKALLIRFCSVFSLLAIVAGVMASASPASAAHQKFVYQMRHSTYGRIGTYTNSIETTGDRTTVTTEGRIRVVDPRHRALSARISIASSAGWANA